jgi:hypothetical protein
MADNEAKSRSGSENRDTTAKRSARFTPEEDAAIEARCQALGCSFAGMVRHDSLGQDAKAPPRRRQPDLDSVLMAQFLAAAARVADPLRALQVEIGNIGSNINQLTRYAHMDRLMAASIITAQHELSGALTRLTEALDDVKELRTAGLQAVGQERLPREHKDGG